MLLILLIESASHPLQQFIHVSMENLVNCQLQDAYNGTKKHMANISMNDHFNEMAKKKKKQKRANHKCKTNTSTNKKKNKNPLKYETMYLTIVRTPRLDCWHIFIMQKF